MRSAQKVGSLRVFVSSGEPELMDTELEAYEYLRTGKIWNCAKAAAILPRLARISPERASRIADVCAQQHYPQLARDVLRESISCILQQPSLMPAGVRLRVELDFLLVVVVGNTIRNQLATCLEPVPVKLIAEKRDVLSARLTSSLRSLDGAAREDPEQAVKCLFLVDSLGLVFSAKVRKLIVEKLQAAHVAVMLDRPDCAQASHLVKGIVRFSERCSQTPPETSMQTMNGADVYEGLQQSAGELKKNMEIRSGSLPLCVHPLALCQCPC